ncbi:hypothetical protein HZC53_05105 [Candidatus Uhrbacteria bacterium]|nr:hypothetical protein [Candidatus Uhrbacteria bacterium]
MPQEEVKKSGETQEQFNLRLSVLQKTLELMTGAFSLVAALAWNDAIQALFLRLFGPQSGIFAKFLYAFIITGIVVWTGFKLSKIQKALEKKNNKCVN